MPHPQSKRAKAAKAKRAKNRRQSTEQDRRETTEAQTRSSDCPGRAPREVRPSPAPQESPRTSSVQAHRGCSDRGHRRSGLVAVAPRPRARWGRAPVQRRPGARHKRVIRRQRANEWPALLERAALRHISDTPSARPVGPCSGARCGCSVVSTGSARTSRRARRRHRAMGLARDHLAKRSGGVAHRGDGLEPPRVIR